MFGKAVARGCLAHEERHCFVDAHKQGNIPLTHRHIPLTLAIVYPGDYHDAKMEVIPPSKAISLVSFVHRRH